MSKDPKKGVVFSCGSPEEPGKIYWSNKSNPEEWPKMKLAIWQTIKWRVSRWKWVGRFTCWITRKHEGVYLWIGNDGLYERCSRCNRFLKIGTPYTYWHGKEPYVRLNIDKWPWEQDDPK